MLPHVYYLITTSLLFTCSAATNLPPPADWAPAIASGDMIFTSSLPEEIGEGFYPIIGNGFLALEVGPFVQERVNSWPWRDAGALKLSGVFTGESFVTPSHRAQLPRVGAVTLVPSHGASSYETVGASIDYSRGIYANRTRIINSPNCTNDTIFEISSYAHRGTRELLMITLRVFPEFQDNITTWSGCSVELQWDTNTPFGLPYSNDTLVQVSQGNNPDTPTVWFGNTLMPEEKGGQLRSFAIAFDQWAADQPTTLEFTPSLPNRTIHIAVRSDLDVEIGTSPSVVAVAAIASWTTAYAQTTASLEKQHIDAMSTLWASGGIELTGNVSLAAIVNASLYDIISSLRSDWRESTSPGGLATGGYSGHTFWDMSCWMFPVLILLHPDLARSTAAYRFDRVNATYDNAATMNESGAHIAWESAVTGHWASPWRDADYDEIHLDADVPLAHRKFFYASGDINFLRESWPLLEGSCLFWQCRFTRTDSSGPPPSEYPTGCSAKNGVGNWTVKHVITPDESSGIVDDSAYTNAAAASTLSWCIEAGLILNISTPQLWATIASSPFLQLNASLTPAGPVHAQQTGYSGKQINQADVALLYYPLNMDFGHEQNQRDLDYYAARTDFSGMFTGDSAYSCAYLELGNRSAADEQLNSAFGHLSQDFNVFTETEITGSAPPVTSGTQHFITGSGGLLQAFLFGYPGLRIQRLGVLSFTAQRPLLPPLGITQVKLRGLHLLNFIIDVGYTESLFCAQLQVHNDDLSGVEIRVIADNSRFNITVEKEVCVGVQALEIAGVGYI